jgi:hypothetical protein
MQEVVMSLVAAVLVYSCMVGTQIDTSSQKVTIF